jgi:hypothetical protein
MIFTCIVETKMDEEHIQQRPERRENPRPEPRTKDMQPNPPRPRWQDMIYPERRHDPYRWLRR